MPHPDHIFIDLETCDYEIRGPRTADEKAHRDKLIVLAETLRVGIAELEEWLADDPADEIHQRHLKKRLELSNEVKRALWEKYWYRCS